MNDLYLGLLIYKNKYRPRNRIIESTQGYYLLVNRYTELREITQKLSSNIERRIIRNIARASAGKKARAKVQPTEEKRFQTKVSPKYYICETTKSEVSLKTHRTTVSSIYQKKVQDYSEFDILKAQNY